MTHDNLYIGHPDDPDCLAKPEAWQKHNVLVYETAARAIRNRSDKQTVSAWDKDGPLQVAAGVLDPLFKAVNYLPLTVGVEKQVQRRDVFKEEKKSDERVYIGRCYFHWHHREMSELTFDLEALRIDREGLHQAVAQYLQTPEIHSEFLDWYCAETICYQEWWATMNYLRGQQLTGWIPLVGDGWWKRRKMTLLLTEMRYVYDVLKTGVFSWEVFWQELNRTREVGAAWPGELYRLAELRR